MSVTILILRPPCYRSGSGETINPKSGIQPIGFWRCRRRADHTRYVEVRRPEAHGTRGFLSERRTRTTILFKRFW